MSQITELLKMTPIEIANENEEDSDVVKMLFKHSTNVNEKNFYGETLLHVVLKKWLDSVEEEKDYYLKIAQALVAKGIDLNEADKHGKKPLVYAIEKRNLHIIEFLRRNRADFSITTVDGKPLVHLIFTAICMNTADEIDMRLFKLLLKHTNIQHKNSEGDTLFHMLIWKWACSLDKHNDYYMKIARALIDKGADVNEPNNYGTRPLLYAVEQHNLCVVEFLEENGADFNVTSHYGETLMHLLLKSGNLVSPSEYENQMDLFDLLLERSTDVYRENSEGDTPFSLVIRKWVTSEEAYVHYYMRMARALTTKVDVDTDESDNYDGKILPFDTIEKFNLNHVFEFLEESEANFSMRTEDGETLMHLLVKGHYCWETLDDEAEMKLFKLLISKGRHQVNAKDKHGRTPLHVAAMYSSVRITQLLIEHGAQVDCKSKDMETPLHFAMRNPEGDDVAGLLLRLGAKVNAKDSKGQTALHKIALESRSEHSLAVLGILLAYGADVNLRDLDNRTALCCARSRDLDDWQCKREAWVVKQNDLIRRRAAENNEDEPAIPVTINDCPIQDLASRLLIALTTQSFKLKVANFPSDELIKRWNGHFLRVNYTRFIYSLIYLKSSKEVKNLKSTFIDNRTSLYDFLHIDLNRKRGYVNNEKLKKLVRSSLKRQKCTFSMYADLIVANYREAAVRKVLQDPARKAWLELTDIILPGVCVDLILSFLDNADLFVMLGD